MVHLVAPVSWSTWLAIGVSPKIIDALDNSIRDELQRNSDTFFFWVLFSAFVVLIGVALEGPEVLHELWPRLFRRFTSKSDEHLTKFNKLIKRIGFVGWFLVVIGVAGEGIFEGLQNRAEGQLQTFGSILLKDARLAASTAKASASDAAIFAETAQGSADNADADARSAQEKANAVGIQGAALDSQLADAKAKLTEVGRKRDELEQSLTNLAICNAPRIIIFRSSEGVTTTDPLRPFAGESVIIEYVHDAEARRAARSLARILKNGSWNVVSVTAVDEDLADGVSIQPSMADWKFLGNMPPSVLRANESAQNAARALLNFLRSYNWQADLIIPRDAKGDVIVDPETIPEGDLRIEIGLYPPVQYVSPPGQHNVARDALQIGRLMKEGREKEKQRREEELANMSPELRQKALEEDKKKSAQRIAQPCQVLDPLP